jgi:hypothetical protein
MPSPDDRSIPPVLRLFESYWTYDPEEEARLRGDFPDRLSWREMLRLHHLACMALQRDSDALAELHSGEPPQNWSGPSGPAADLLRETTGALLTEDSPYRPRPCAVWQTPRPSENPNDDDAEIPGVGAEEGEEEDSAPEEMPEPSLFGWLRNASITHLGSLEVARLDKDHRPKEVAFVPFDNLQSAFFAPPALLRPAKILYDDGRPEEVVAVPLLYPFSWRTGNGFDRDGSITRFVWHLDGIKGVAGRLGVGVGHQDFAIETMARADASSEEEAAAGDTALFGLGSVNALTFALALTDPMFDRRCHARGIDPNEARRRAGEM